MGKSPYVRCPLKQFPGALVLNPERLRGSKPSLKKFPGGPMVGRSGLRGGFPLGEGDANKRQAERVRLFFYILPFFLYLATASLMRSLGIRRSLMDWS